MRSQTLEIPWIAVERPQLIGEIVEVVVVVVVACAWLVVALRAAEAVVQPLRYEVVVEVS